jgi:hypothetical protein
MPARLNIRLRLTSSVLVIPGKIGNIPSFTETFGAGSNIARCCPENFYPVDFLGFLGLSLP